ncbi:MAG: hypothetical protein KBS60_01045 [Phascolarctobacterium sp.]|nr:hypothetical protein [Candidatus Phascolarctobacterium caballi]
MRKITGRLIFGTYMTANILALLLFAGIVFLNAEDMGVTSATNNYANIDKIVYNDGGVITSGNQPFGVYTAKKKKGDRFEKFFNPKGNNNNVRKPKVKVVGVLPPDVAILNTGSNFFTLRVGEKCPVGVLNDVSNEGVYLNEEFIKFEK